MSSFITIKKCYNKAMARRTQRQKNPPKRRLTKAELEKQKAIKRMIASFSCALLLVFAMLRLGALGVTLYNLIRFMVGDLANLLMLAVLFYLFFFKWLRQKDGLIAGFIILFLGLLVEWHAYLFSLPQLAHQAIVAGTIQLITNDLLAFKVSEFVGGGMLGAMLYKPISFLFSNIGSYFIGFLFILLGLFLMTPWDIYDVSHFVKTLFEKLSLAYQENKEKRFVEARKATIAG